MAEPERVDVSAAIERMKQVFEVKHDVDLCDALELGRSTVATWRHHKSVPYGHCAQIALSKGVSLDWLVLGRGERAVDSALGAVAEPPAPAYADPRIARMVQFITAWPAGRDSDDVAWLERTLARNVQEYGQWLASQTTDASPSTVEGQDKSDP